MTKNALRTLASLAVLAALSLPHATRPQTCTDTSARNLLAGAYADSVLNPPGQEDNQFFTSPGGFPNIFFLIDTSGSMQRLPPNGPPSGASGVLPPVGQVGCGSAVARGGLPSGTILDLVKSRAYHSPCGLTPQDNLTYAGHPSQATGVDYAQAAAICPYYTPSNTFATGVPGYDQDFYAASNALTSGSGSPNLFPKDLVFHDSLYGDTWNASATDPNGDYGDGWTFTGLYPWRNGSGTIGTVTTTAGVDSWDYCAAQGATLQNGVTRQDICNTCLSTRGWYYDGHVRTWGAEFGTVQIPSLWYTGNYLSFFPPKFVVARRVVKDVISNQTKIRMALAQFGSNDYTFVRDFNPSCQSIFGNGNWEQNRSTYVNDVNALDWGGNTPLAMSLFDVGRYYHTASLPWFGSTWEKSSTGWESATSANQLAVCWSCQVSSVIILTDGVPSDGDGNSLPNKAGATPTSPCASIANSNSGKYAGDTSTCIRTPSAADCPRCYDFTGTDADMNNLAKVAFYLHNYDLRGEAAGACGGNGGTLDGKGMPGKQVLDIYTVGFGTGGVGMANRILSNTAQAGGGLFYSAESASELKAGVFNVFTAINERATSFSVATVSTLQTTTGHSVIVPRFDPSRDPHWAGHLFRYELYSEFVNSCTPNGPGDLDCDGLCVSVFLTDKDGHFIGEDGSGSFMQTDNNLPPCSQTPQCVALAKSCGTLTNVPANPWWDAYQALKDQGWKTRHVWTVTDDMAPLGQIDASDTMFELNPQNAGPTDAVADKLIPYLGLGTTGGVCASIASKIQTAGDPITAQVVASSKRECAKTVIRWLLGADVLNEVGRNPAQGWPPPRPNMSLPPTVGDPTADPPVAANLPDQDQLLDRNFKLGDIYHSSPVVVDAPLPSDGILCPNGLHNQCMESLWRTPVKHLNDENQYDLYSKSADFENRRKVILVGSNDGLLHAFNGGGWHPGQDDLVTNGIDESKAPFDGYYDRGEEAGPVELWAFLPPDLLAKIPNLIGNDHHLFVDGTAMVRDVWVDGGTGNGLSPAPALDGKKSASEFHTVAVVGERRGGTHYFALDVTKATYLPTETGDHGPRFLWLYPQPNDPESLRFGETYTEFLPVPPPVGPVRIKADANSQSYGLADATNAPLMYVPETPTVPVPYHELWVTLLPGGFDPNYLRGRGVHMVDVWRGKEVFDFSFPANGVANGWNDPRMFLQYPVAATPGMVMWGKQSRRPSLGWENDGYFDTATFGDTGGQLWALRFNRPGQMDTTGRTTNWSGGRIFMNGPWIGSYTASFCGNDDGLPFYYVTANTALPGSHVFRVYAGTGDRFNLLDTNGGVCGPDNPRACAQKGCTVNLPLADNVVTATGAGYDGRGLSQPACPTSGQALFTRTLNVTNATPACGVAASSHMEVAGCPNATGATAFSKDVAISCTADADGNYGCAKTKASNPAAMATYGSAIDQTPSFGTHPMPLHWYYSLLVFTDGGYRNIFDSPSGAATYDYWVFMLRGMISSTTEPLTPALYNSTWGLAPPMVVIDGSTATGPVADSSSGGWAIYYNHGPTVTTDGHTYNVNPLDERTSSVSGLYGKVLWNTLQPALGEATASVAGCNQSKCQGAFRRLAYHYGADAVSGGSVFTDASGNLVRSIVSNTLVPAQGDQPTVFVNQKGQIAVGLTAVNPEKGASNLGMGAAMDPVMGLGVSEVSRDLHDCRHYQPLGGPSASLTATERAALAKKCAPQP